MNSLCFIVIHHVLLQQRWCSENLSTDIARRLAHPMDVSHVIEERSLCWTHFRADVTLIYDIFGLSNTVNRKFE